MTVSRLFGKQSRFVCCRVRQHRTSAITNKSYSDQHARHGSTVSGTDASLDTEVLLQKFVNYEQQGVPDSAGTSGNKTFDLVIRHACPA